MAGTRNHYETAFSALLCRQARAAISVQEHRRPVMAGRELKNFDYLVNGPSRVWALDLKGRRGTPWITRTDLFSMLGWQSLFAGRADTGFVFGFFTPLDKKPPACGRLAATLVHTSAGDYRFCLLDIAAAQRLARPRSRRWATFGFEWNAFAAAVRPLEGAVLP